MFFRTRIDATEFGEELARRIGSRMPQILLSMERRFALRGEVDGATLDEAYDFRRGSFDYDAFTICWLISLSYLIPVGTHDRRAHNIQRGMLRIVTQYALDKGIDLDYVDDLSSVILEIIEEDEILASSGYLQDYDANEHREWQDRIGVSYRLADYVFRNSCEVDAPDAVGLVMSGLVLELETDFRLGLHLHKACKIV